MGGGGTAFRGCGQSLECGLGCPLLRVQDSGGIEWTLGGKWRGVGCRPGGLCLHSYPRSPQWLGTVAALFPLNLTASPCDMLFIISQTEKLRLRKMKCLAQSHRAGFLTQMTFRNSDYKPPPDIRERWHPFRSSLKCRFLGFDPHQCIKSFKGGARKSVFNKLPM